MRAIGLTGFGNENRRIVLENIANSAKRGRPFSWMELSAAYFGQNTQRALYYSGRVLSNVNQASLSPEAPEIIVGRNTNIIS